MANEDVKLTEKEKKYIKKREDREKGRVGLTSDMRYFLSPYLNPPNTYRTTKMLEHLIRDMKIYLLQ